MINLKTKIDKTKSISTDIKIKKKNKVKTVFKSLAVFSLITAGTAVYFYNTQVAPQAEEINKTIKNNREYLSTVKPSIFEMPYTDQDFNKDLALFDKFYKVFSKNQSNKKQAYKRDVFTYFDEIVYLNTLDPTLGYDELYDKVMTIPGSILKVVKMPEGVEREEGLKNISLNERFMTQHFGKYTKVNPYMSSEGFWTPTNVGYNNIIKAFKDKYNENSYAESFIINGSYLYGVDEEANNYVQQKARRDKINEDIEKAYYSQDYGKLRLYFKQKREFFKYIAGLDIGNNKFSVAAREPYIENNFIDVVRFTMIYKSLGNQDKNEVMENMGLF